MQLNINQDEIEKLLEETYDGESSHDVVPAAPPPEFNMVDILRDDKTWFIRCDRPQADSLLKDKPPGTFLIRPRNENSWALSIV